MTPFVRVHLDLQVSLLLGEETTKVFESLMIPRVGEGALVVVKSSFRDDESFDPEGSVWLEHRYSTYKLWIIAGSNRTPAMVATILAHELGHVALGHVDTTRELCTSELIEQELEAWQWALRLMRERGIEWSPETLLLGLGHHVARLKEGE